eukprot:gene6184-6021_t
MLRAGVASGVSWGDKKGDRTRVFNGDGTRVRKGVDQGEGRKVGPGELTGVRPRVPSGVPAGVPPGVTKGLPCGVAAGLPAGLPPGVPAGVGTGLRPALGKGVPSGVPAGVPAGVPTGLPKGVPTGLTTGVPTGEGNGVAQRGFSQSACKYAEVNAEGLGTLSPKQLATDLPGDGRALYDDIHATAPALNATSSPDDVQSWLAHFSLVDSCGGVLDGTNGKSLMRMSREDIEDQAPGKGALIHRLARMQQPPITSDTLSADTGAEGVDALLRSEGYAPSAFGAVSAAELLSMPVSDLSVRSPAGSGTLLSGALYGDMRPTHTSWQVGLWLEHKGFTHLAEALSGLTGAQLLRMPFAELHAKAGSSSKALFACLHNANVSVIGPDMSAAEVRKQLKKKGLGRLADDLAQSKAWTKQGKKASGEELARLTCQQLQTMLPDTGGWLYDVIHHSQQL